MCTPFVKFPLLSRDVSRIRTCGAPWGSGTAEAEEVEAAGPGRNRRTWNGCEKYWEGGRKNSDRLVRCGRVRPRGPVRPRAAPWRTIPPGCSLAEEKEGKGFVFLCDLSR